MSYVNDLQQHSQQTKAEAQSLYMNNGNTIVWNKKTFRQEFSKNE